MRVAFQGEHGAYSEEAIHKHFGENVETVPCRTIREAFNLAEVGDVDYAVVPIENSIEGSVYETYDMLLTTSAKVVGEIILRIIHCLIALPETGIKDVKRIYSHPQALGQCMGFISSLGAEPVITYDTAGSVKMIKEQKLRDAAAIASERAAKLYGLNVIARGIEDYGRNFTRFLIISRHEAPKAEDCKTSLIFSLPHVPGSLYNALGEFAKRRINLTKIESRPTRQRPWEYYFFLDFEGHQDENPYKEALSALAKKAIFLKVLGSYPKARTEL